MKLRLGGPLWLEGDVHEFVEFALHYADEQEALSRSKPIEGRIVGPRARPPANKKPARAAPTSRRSSRSSAVTTGVLRWIRDEKRLKFTVQEARAQFPDKPDKILATEISVSKSRLQKRLGGKWELRPGPHGSIVNVLVGSSAPAASDVEVTSSGTRPRASAGAGRAASPGSPATDDSGD